MGQRGPGSLFVISAPSGTGKSTLARRVVDLLPGLGFSVSFTTRPPRVGETEGREYYFRSREQFEQMIREGAFVEWAEVFGNLYGTGLKVTREALESGKDLLLDIDVQGAGQVRGGPIEAVSVMILPPDYPTLEARLRGRASEEEQERDRRLATARAEAEDYSKFDYLVVNEDLDRAVETVAAIVRAERCRSGRREADAARILATFPDRE